MQKILTMLAAAALLLCVLAPRAQALEPTEELAASFGTDKLAGGLGSGAQSLLAGETPTQSGGFLHAISNVFSRALLQSGGFFREAGAAGAALLAISLLCGLCGAMQAPRSAVAMAGLLAVGTVSLTGVRSLIGAAADAVQEMGVFSKLLLPSLGAAAVSSGALTAGPAIYGLTVLLTDFLFSCVTDWLIPLIYVFLGLALADCALENRALRRFRELLAWVIRTGMKTVVYGFTAFLALTQVITGTADAFTAKAAKLTLSGAVPVVGSILSDASETVLLSAGLLRRSIGVYGMLAVLAICVLPFLRTASWYLVLKATAALSGMAAGEPLTAMIDAVREALGLLLGMTGACALLLLVSSACSLKAVGA